MSERYRLTLLVLQSAKHACRLHLCRLLSVSHYSLLASQLLIPCLFGVTAERNVRSWRHGNGSRVIDLTDQRSTLAFLLNRDATLAANSGLSSRERAFELFWARLTVVASREDAVLHMQRCIHVFARCTCAGLQEAFLEVVTQKCVENWVHGGVGVAQKSGEQEDSEADNGLALVRRGENEGHLKSGLDIWASVISTLWWHSAPSDSAGPRI